MTRDDTIPGKNALPINRPIIPLTLALTAGIFAGDRVAFPAGCGVLCLMIAIGLGLFILLAFIKKPAIWLLMLLFFSIGIFGIIKKNSPHFSDNHVTRFASGKPYTITGTVREITRATDRRITFILCPESFEKENIRFDVTGDIRMSLMSSTGESVSLGDRVRATGTPRPIRNFMNPGHFDYQRYMAFQGVWVTVSVKEGSFAILEKGAAAGIMRHVTSVRDHIGKKISEKHGTEDEKNVLKALITGERQSISDDLTDKFNRSGATHILSISGLHVGIVASFSFFLFRWMLSFSSFFLWRAWTRKGAAILSFFPVLGYGLISGMSHATERSVIMVSVFLFSLLVEREQDILNTLALAALVILLSTPQALFSISFQLSFVAVLSIIVGVNAVTRKKSTPSASLKERMVRRLVPFMLVSFFAILGTLPLTLWHFNQTSTIGLLTNLFLVPLFGFTVIPLGLIAVGLIPILPSVSDILLQLTLWFLHIGVEFIHVTGSLSFSAITTLTPTPFILVCYYLIFFAGLDLVRKSFTDHAGKEPAQEREGFRNRKRLWGVIFATLLVLVIHLGFLFHDRFYNKTLRLTAIDVGQGSATLVQFPRGKTMLIDGGGFPDNSLFDVGKNILAPFLLQAHIKTIDLMILTHPESDHLNGLLHILDRFTVKRLITNDEKKDTQGFRELHRIRSDRGIPHSSFSGNDRLRTIDGVEVRLLYPTAGNKPEDEPLLFPSSNNNSVVTRISFGNISFLLPGDIMKQAEALLVKTYGSAALESTVLFIPHHGSGTSSSAPFLNAVKPEVAVISVGWRNRFRMPSKVVLKRFEEMACRIYRTDQNGAIRLVTDGKTLSVHPYLPCR